MRKRGQRPKLEDFGDYMFLVYYGAREGTGAEVELQEVHAFLSGDYIVTAHAGKIAALEEARQHLTATAPRSEQFVVYRVLDALTDTFFPVLEKLDEALEKLDEEIFDQPTPAHLRADHDDAAAAGRPAPGGDPAARPARPRHRRHHRNPRAGEADSREYFRDVYDHAIRISEQIDSFRDLLSGSRDAYLSTVSNRLNQITKQLTVVATVFLPLSFVVGFFGQNFGWMVRNINSAADFFVLGVGSLLVSVVVLWAWFRRGSYV